MLKRHRLALTLFALVGLAAGIAVTAMQTPVYRAITSLEVLNLNENFMNLKQSSPVSDVDSSYDTSEVETQVKILQNEVPESSPSSIPAIKPSRRSSSPCRS
jgi:uncharacterized protein involved in exopolysaccharide biosynthesis